MASSALTTAAPNTSATPTHPTYTTWAPKWRDLVCVYEGSGGFLNGSYIIHHPREMLDHSISQKVQVTETDPNTGEQRTTERVVTVPNPNPQKPSPKLIERRKIASYENIAATIIDQKLDALTRQEPARRVKGQNQDHDWITWANTDCDGSGTKLTDFMKDAKRLALLFGHSVIVMDRVGGTENPLTRAEQGTPALRLYSPLDMPDWLQDGTGALTEVKLFEVAPRTSLREPSVGETSYRLRYLNAETFEVVAETSKASASGKTRVLESETIDKGPHGFGRLPVVILYSKRRALTPLIGQSVLNDPQLHIDYYNLESELRELLRKQTFSIINVPLGSGEGATDLASAQAMMGASTGTANVLFTPVAATYISADKSNVDAYLEVKAAKLRTIYRLANVPFESDSKDAEAEGSLKLKREDMNQILSGYATEMERAEVQIAELWFRGTYGDSWQKEWDRVAPSVSYPDTFDVTPFEEILQRAEAALALPLGRSKTFITELSKQIAPLLLTDATPETMEAIFEEIEKLPDPEEERKARLKEMAGAFDAKPGDEPPPDPPEPPA